jgi:predicted outer membrane repeat protein
MGIIANGQPRRTWVRAGRHFMTRTAAAAAAALLCGVFGLAAIVVEGAPSGAATSATLYVDNVNGTATTGCTSPGAGACKTIQEGVTAAQLLAAGTAITLDVAGSSTTYTETPTVTITLTAAGNSLDIEGTGSTLPTLNNGGTGSNITLAPTNVDNVTINHMTISGGSSTTFGGAINNFGGGNLTVGNDTFSNNTATNGNGGAISGGAGTVTVTDSTFSDNTTTTLNGGAIAAPAGATITNSTFTGNTAPGGHGAVWGAGLTLVQDTLFGNADIALFATGGTNSIAGSILDDATGGECSGTFTDGGYNVAADATCALGSTSIQNSTTIGTLTLAANGSTGPQTAAITPTSSAYQLVPKSACTVTTDERGQMRPGFGKSACDAGAYEFQKSTGYDLAGSDGGVFVFPVGQPKGFFGSLPGLGIHISNVVGLVPTLNYNGYDLAGTDGGVFVFPVGLPAGFFGSLPGLGVKVSNIVGMVSTNNTQGYNLVGSDGGVFVFPTGQTAGFYGSLPGLGVHTNDIVGIVEQPDGKGYLLVGRDGGVFAFGDAQYYGSLPGSNISVNNIVGIAPTATGKGYYLVGANGAVYPFGDAISHGSLPAMGINVSNIVSVVPTADRGGYWLIGSDGGVFAFGDAGFIGSLPGLNVTPYRPIVGAVPTAF